MRRHTMIVLTGAACALFVSVGAVPALAQAGDQSRLDAAIDAFEQRLTDAGWVGEPADDDEDEDEDEGDVTMGGDDFEECFGELAAVFENIEDVDDDEFPGQTAMRESLEFTYSPDGVPETTEEFSFDFGSEETVAAVALSVDESSVELLDTFVEQMGNKATGDCIRQAMEADMTGDSAAPGEIAMDFDYHVENEADLGIGDRSARLAFGFGGSLMGMPMVIDVDMYLVRVDRDLMMLMHGTFGESDVASAFDPLAELQTLVDSL